MLRGYWFAAIAVGLSLALPVMGNSQEYPATVNPFEYNENQQPSQVSPPLIAVVIVENQAEAEARAAAEQRAEQRELDDLAAQDGMNNANQRMADYALYQTILVFIGTVLLFVTLWLTRQANRAAQDAVAVTREHGVIQLRPWISFTNWELQGVGVEGDIKGYVIVLNWRNAGSTPAIGMLALTGFENAPEFREEHSIFDGDASGGTTVAPGLPFSTDLELTADQILASTEEPIRFRSFIQYDTSFDGVAGRVTAATFELKYIGLGGIEQIREGKIGASNFILRPIGGKSRMT